ncbi:MAG: hypothetical protein R3C28_28480 [Pirellulaceae bacterium]
MGQIEDTSGDYDGTLIKSEGQGSLVDLSSLVNFIDNDSAFSSTMSASLGAHILATSLAQTANVIITEEAGGVVHAPCGCCGGGGGLVVSGTELEKGTGWSIRFLTAEA